TTPYVLGALRYARSCRAKTVAVTCNRAAPLARIADLVIAPQVGPEVIAGSTRLKAGTAQKLVLNMLSTAAMVRLGYVYDNWMIQVATANRKLRERALRILQQAAGTSRQKAARALAQAAAAAPRTGTPHSRNALPVALIMLKRRLGAAEAWRRLRTAGGNLRRALGESSRP
ncbi:MAG: N-acetylmuramic acid 6-phosphate etherase, partial [Firmicutes bacterium]|nr:N-acetylmuramic acid 6-phosphate etherase [Bacillota bacterium]